MAVKDIALKLTLNALGAQETASGLAKGVDDIGKKFENTGRQMENTIRGRLIKGALGAFRDNFDNLVNRDVPQIIRGAQFVPEMARVMGNAVKQGLGDIAAKFAEMSQGPGLRAAQSTTQAIMQLSATTGMPLGQEATNALTTRFFDTSLALEAARHTQAAQLNTALTLDQTGRPAKERIVIGDPLEAVKLAGKELGGVAKTTAKATLSTVGSWLGF